MKKRIIKIISAICLFIGAMSFTKADAFSFKNSKPQETIQENENSVIILGGGIGALTSGIYLARAGYEPIIIEGDLPGGLITQSHSVENWPGEVQISGTDLVDKVKNQAKKNGCKFLSKQVIDVDFSNKPFVITTKDLYDNSIQKLKASTCIIAMGTSSNYLKVKGEQEFWGNGVSNCAVCDGSFYKDKKVAIIGGGDAAIVEANYLSKLASKVYIIVRKDTFRAKDNQKVKELNKKSNISILYNSELASINGDDNGVNSVDLKNNKTNKTSKLNLDGVFLAIGSKPNSQIFQNKLKLSDQGYIKVTENMQTSVDGVFAIGDIVDPIYKQAITAAGDGAKAAIACQKLLEDIDVKSTFVAKQETSKTYSSNVIEISSSEQFLKELNSDTPVIVDFYATWCRPCQRISPLFDTGAKNLYGKVKILKVNVDKVKSISSQYQVRSMPTMLVFDKDKNVLFKKIGQNSISDVMISLDKLKDKSTDEINSYLKDQN